MVPSSPSSTTHSSIPPSNIMEPYPEFQQPHISSSIPNNFHNFFLFSATLLIIYSIHLIRTWRNPKFKGKLPPGSMGLPLVGETMELFTTSHSFDVHPFITNRVKRYGSVFKTSLFGTKLVVSADAELNRMVFQQEGTLFESWYPESFKRIFGLDNVSEYFGPSFKYLKSMFLKLLGSPNLRDVLIKDVEKEACTFLSFWSTKPSIELKSELGSMIFNVIARRLISYDSSAATEDMKENFSAFSTGLLSFPLNVPGTSYHKSMKGRKNVIELLRKLLSERKNSPPKACTDFLDFIVEELRGDNSMFTESVALDLMFALLYASSETPGPALCLAVKFLADHPKALEELTEEHEAIIKKRKDANSEITWEEYKSMKFTFCVINETVRLANIAPVIFRKVLKDIHINGYTIPAGFKVMISMLTAHLNPDVYEDPLAFNPWRWKDKPELNVGNKNFVPFGGGMRQCVGSEFTKLEMAIFLHCLVTKYRWNSIKGGNAIRSPGLGFPDGYHIQVFPKY